MEQNQFIRYVIRFLFIFSVLYFGTEAIIAATAPGGLYVGFIDKYLNYVAWLRKGLLLCSKGLLSIFGIHSTVEGKYLLRIERGDAVRLVYSCLGYGLMSFWAAFVIANSAKVMKSIYWVMIGCLLITFINICRISLLLVAVNRHWEVPMRVDHHTLFNIFAYILILLLMYCFHKNSKIESNGGQAFNV
jgi:exosortase/archaeosortase family protein